MEEKRENPRFALMKRVEALWEDDTHAQRSARGTILDRSLGGICLQISIPIDIGSKLTIKGASEQLSGIVVNSRREKEDYILGIQFDGPAKPDAT
jgi:PilZ domain